MATETAAFASTNHQQPARQRPNMQDQAAASLRSASMAASLGDRPVSREDGECAATGVARWWTLTQKSHEVRVCRSGQQQSLLATQSR